MRGRIRGGFGIIRGRRGKTVGLVKNRRLMAMHPPSPRLRRTGKQQRAKASKPRFAIIDTRNRKKFFRAVIEFPGSGDPDEPWEEQGEEE